MSELTVHKNTLEQRKRKKLRKALQETSRMVATNSEVSEKLCGYVIMGWDEDGITEAYWQRGNISSCLIGEYVKQQLNRMHNRIDTQEMIDEDKE